MSTDDDYTLTKNKLDNQLITVEQGQVTVHLFLYSNYSKTNSYNIDKRIHYKSLLNISKGIFEVYQSKKCEELKDLLVQYINILETVDQPISKLESLTLYNSYIYPVAYHLERKLGYIAVYNLHMKVGIGIILDVILWYILLSKVFYFLPVFTILLYIKGRNTVSKAKKEGKYFAEGY